MKATLKIPASLAMVLLTACQTTGINGENVNPDEAALARELFASTCVLTRTKGSNKSSKSTQMAEASIMSITDRHDGWRAADIAYRGFRGNFYFNTKSAEVICGSKAWGDYQAGTYHPPKHPVLANSASGTGISPEQRPIAVSWEGYAELFSGTVREVRNNRGQGTVAIVLPNNEGQCTGGYQATSRTVGTWTIECTNGLAAEGTYTAYGDGKGASGEGVDKQGRKVTYTLGGRT